MSKAKEIPNRNTRDCRLVLVAGRVCLKAEGVVLDMADVLQALPCTRLEPLEPSLAGTLTPIPITRLDEHDTARLKALAQELA